MITLSSAVILNLFMSLFALAVPFDRHLPTKHCQSVFRALKCVNAVYKICSCPTHLSQQKNVVYKLSMFACLSSVKVYLLYLMICDF